MSSSSDQIFLLIKALSRRDIEQKFKGTFAGIFWYIIQNLFLLLLYSFVFGTLFNSRWKIEGNLEANFTLALFLGMIIFNLFSENLSRSTSLITANVSYIKKIVFPVEILVPVNLIASLFNALVAFLLYLLLALVMGSFPSMHIILLPLVIAPFIIMALGICWFLASFCVYVRDTAQLVSLLISGAMFMSPLFIPVSAMPDYFRIAIQFNPISIPIDGARKVVLFGQYPDVLPLILYWLAALVIGVLGYQWFQKTKGGFADVL